LSKQVFLTPLATAGA